MNALLTKVFDPKSFGTRYKNEIFVAIVVLSNSVGNLLLAFAMNEMPDFWKGVLHYLVALMTDPWMIAGTALMIIYMLAQLTLFSWADLSYVLPITASTYLITAILGRFFLHEHISFARWAGIALISFGVVLVAETPPHTKKPASGGGQ